MVHLPNMAFLPQFSRSAAANAELPYDSTIVVASYRRSGTHLTIDSLLNNGAGLYPEYVNLDRLSSRAPKHLDLQQFGKVFDKAARRRVVVKTHAPDTLIDLKTEAERQVFSSVLERSKKLYVCRDPKDVMVSFWYYRQSFSPDYAQRTRFSDHVARYCAQWRDHVNHWLDQDTMVVRFEDWAEDYDKTLARVAGHLGLELKEGPTNRIYGALPSAAEKGSLGLLSRIRNRLRLGARVTAVAPRKGTVGDWREHFTPEDREAVLSICGEALLIRLGYF